jgi:hypothetical protein
MRKKPRVGSRSDLRFHVPPPEGGSGLEATAQVGALAREFDRDLDAWARKASQRAEVRERWRRALVDTVGEEALRRFRSYSREQRESNYGLGPITPDRHGLGRLNEARRAAHRGSFQLMREFGVDAGRLRAVHDEFARDLKASIRVADPSQGSPGDLPAAGAFGPVIDEEVPDIGPAIDWGTEGGTGDGWHRRTPPFDGWSYGYVLSWRGGNDPLIRDVGSGDLIGISFFWENTDAGDDDLLELSSDSSTGVWYYAPRAGQIEVQARFGTAASPVGHVTLNNEWGWSNSELSGTNYVYANVTPPGTGYPMSPTWAVDVSGAPDSYTHYGLSGPARAIVQSKLGPVPGPGWVWVSAGTYTKVDIYVNDVSVDVSVSSKWDVNEVLMRMV